MEELNSGSRVHMEIAHTKAPYIACWTLASIILNRTKIVDFVADSKELKPRFPDIRRSNNHKVPWNHSQEQFLLHLLQCFPQAPRGGWSEDTWKIVTQAMNENFPDSNFTIRQLMQHEQYMIRRQRLKRSSWPSGSCTKIIPYYHEPVAVYEGPHLEAKVETKSAITQIGIWGDTAHNSLRFINRLCRSLPLPKEEGSMNNLNSSSTVPESVMSENLQVQQVNFHSFNTSSTIIPPCGDICGSNCENKIIFNNDVQINYNDSDIGRNHRLSAPISPDLASNSQQPDKHDSFYRMKHIRKVRGKRNCKKLRAEKSDFSVT